MRWGWRGVGGEKHFVAVARFGQQGAGNMTGKWTKTAMLGAVLSLMLIVGIDRSGGNRALAAEPAKKIVYIPKNTGNPYFLPLIAGFERGCKDQGVEFVSVGPSSPDATSQIPLLKAQIQQGAGAICISPNSPDALNATFDRAKAKGIKVIMVNSDIPGNESHRDAAVLPTDFDKLGASQIELLGSLINYEGSFAILSATTDAPDQNYWIKGMKEALNDPKYAKMKLLDVVYGDDKPEKSRKEAEGLLTKYPDIRAILSPTTVGVEQAAKTVEAAGVFPGGPNAKAHGVVVTGLGTPNQMRSYIEKGVVQAVALWSPEDEGYLASYLAVALSTGKIKAEPGASIEVPKLGTRTLGKDNVVITGPPVVFTKDNIAQFNF
jgi:rhamnose transport system substrate-binding protein